MSAKAEKEEKEEKTKVKKAIEKGNKDGARCGAVRVKGRHSHCGVVVGAHTVLIVLCCVT